MNNGVKNEVDISDMIPIIEETLKNGKSVKFKIRGKSMYPTLIENRDSVILEAPKKIKVCDIILYKRSNGHYVLHRVVGKKKGALMLCGDNQKDIEYPIYENQVIAVATTLYRKDKEIKPGDFMYSMAAHLWTWLIPLRPFIMNKTLEFLSNKNRRRRT